MCELLGINSNIPTEVNNSLSILRKRGGESGDHVDGWGIAFYDGRSSRIFKEELPASKSQCMEFISHYNFKSEIVIAHIRKATQDIENCVANTHPFEREFLGRSFVFAHNGEVPEIINHKDFQLKWYFPKGGTDSEYEFCYIMDCLRNTSGFSKALFTTAEFDLIYKVASEIALLGRFNFFLSDSKYLIAYNDHRNDDELYYVLRHCKCGHEDIIDQYVAVVATNPTTDNEDWVKLKPGEMIVFNRGKVKTRYPIIFIKP